MIPAEAIERARAVRIEDVIAAHGVRLRGRVERIGPCPICGGTDRFAINTKKQLFNCRGCEAKGDSIALERFLAGTGFADAVENLAGGSWRPSPSPPVAKAIPGASRPPATTTPGALAIWRASIDPRGTLAETYLRSRSLALGDDLAGEAIRWHPGIGAMLALFRDIVTDEPRGLCRTYLDGEGRKIERKFLGQVGGSAVKLDSDDSVLGGLHIGEGVETCMAARQLGLRPCWALGSAGAITAFPVLGGGIECLSIIADNDASGVGEKAAHEAARRWLDAGREARILMRDALGDFNDCLKASA